ncbi:MAG: threonylcarbamoyl-AMP synthase [Burkholderiaceae bacterium]|nr:threonylcarbamoyl-AMP synthase [Burkholderiaceae bacterium]
MPLLRGDDPAAVAAAAQRLADGGLVAFATETVYGLGARADDDAAVAAIFAAKGRPADHPLIVHVAAPAQAAAFATAFATTFAADLPAAARRLAEAFWPGPVTVIVPRAAGIGAAAAGGQPTIGLRCPSHPVAQALLREAAARGVPGVAAPSANRFGRVSPTTAAHVALEFGPDLWVLDGGACPVGIESAIVDCSRGAPVLLRPGVLTRARLEAALGEPLRAADDQAPRAPGTLASHYAPRAQVRLWAAADRVGAPGLAPERTGLAGARGVAVYSRRPVPECPGLAWRRMPDDPAAVARELFAVLRQFDDADVAEIWIEQPPDEPAWEGVRDRLRRAATA